MQNEVDAFILVVGQKITSQVCEVETKERLIFIRSSLCELINNGIH